MTSRRERRQHQASVRMMDYAPLPKILQWLLCAAFLTAGIASLPSLGKFGPLPITEILDVWIALLALFALFRGHWKMKLVTAILVGYLAAIGILFLLGDSPLYDFLQAYRWLYYLTVICFTVGKVWTDVRALTITTSSLIGLALIKSILTFFILGEGERPGLLLENNYEVALFCGLVAVILPLVSRWWQTGLILSVGALVILGQSRSGAIIFAILVIYYLMQLGIPRKVLAIGSVVVVPVIVAIPAVIFFERMSSFRIDRLNFLDRFLYDVQDRDIIGWIFGVKPITPLPQETCNSLSYYQLLFSSRGDGECYSVIYHAFILRVLHDSGALGLILVLSVTILALYRARVSTGLIIVLMAIGLANSASVSGWNNPYIVLPIVISILVSPVALYRAQGSKEPDKRYTTLDAALDLNFRTLIDRFRSSSSRRRYRIDDKGASLTGSSRSRASERSEAAGFEQ